MNVTVYPGSIRGTVRIPASKSHTIRALIIASLADGVSRIDNPLDSADTRSCMAVLRQLGTSIAESRDSSDNLISLAVTGRRGTLTPPEEPLDCGNSGTTFYVMLSVAALANFPITLTGDAQLRSRSAGPLLAALEDLGVVVTREGAGDCAPITVTGPLRGGETTVECSTSQYLTSLLLACPLARANTRLHVPLLNERPYVDITIGWLESQGIFPAHDGWSVFRVPGGQSYRPFNSQVAGDFSAATFLLAAAAITASTLDLTGLDMSDRQGDREVVKTLEQLGCEVADTETLIRITGPKHSLAGGMVDLNSMPDALPALAVVGTACSAPLRLSNVPQAREKETDRIAVMATELTRIGARVEELADGLVVYPSTLTGGTVSSHGDHRVAMALAVAGLRTESPLTVTNAEVAGITYPGFYEALADCGGTIVKG